jgi:hypothetical protein
MTGHRDSKVGRDGRRTYRPDPDLTDRRRTLADRAERAAERFSPGTPHEGF